MMMMDLLYFVVKMLNLFLAHNIQTNRQTNNAVGFLDECKNVCWQKRALEICYGSPSYNAMLSAKMSKQDILVDTWSLLILHTCRTVPEKLPPTPSQKMSTCNVDNDQCWQYCTQKMEVMMRRMKRWWGSMKNRLRRCQSVTWIKLMMTGEVGLIVQ